MATFGNDFRVKKPQIFCCDLCDFISCNKKDFTRHVNTKKHIFNQMELNGTNFTSKKPQKGLKNPKPYQCNCGKQYKDKSGLWKHTQKCEVELSIKEPTDKDLIMMLIKENSELKNVMMKVLENGTNNTNTINHTNSHNKSFNLNFFLNETCKHAMNINDFVDSIKIQLSDLMELGEIGYVESMSKIIVKNLNALDETIRPIHCMDKKRETFYIKDENKWEKEGEDLKKLKNLIRKVSNKNIRILPQYREKFPDYNNSDSIHSDEHCKIIIEAMICDNGKDEKIIRNISKATIISKEFSLSS